MLARRIALSAVALALSVLLFSDAAYAQRGRGAGDDRGVKATPEAGLVDGYTCPACGKEIDTPDGIPPGTCPHCKAKLDSKKNADGTYTLSYTEVSENKWKKPLLIGGGVLLVLGLIGVVLKYTVFAAPPPKKKKKKRRDEDDDDRPRKKKRPVDYDDDEDDDRPRNVKKKPRIIEDDE